MISLQNLQALLNWNKKNIMPTILDALTRTRLNIFFSKQMYLEYMWIRFFLYFWINHNVTT